VPWFIQVKHVGTSSAECFPLAAICWKQAFLKLEGI
jgi:hypothetical protein